jgi:hypothetical protein
MAETPRYLSLPFANAPVFQEGQHVGFTVGVTLNHEGQSVTEAVDVICGPEQAAALSTGPIEAYTAWSRQALIDHDLVAKANAAMNAKFAAVTSGLPK